MTGRRHPRRNVDKGNVEKLEALALAQRDQTHETTFVRPRKGLTDRSLQAWDAFARALAKHGVIEGLRYEDGALTFPRTSKVPVQWTDPDSQARTRALRDSRRGEQPTPSVRSKSLSKKRMTIEEFQELVDRADALGITLVTR